jgi:hypothetical protein
LGGVEVAELGQELEEVGGVVGGRVGGTDC